MLARFVGEGGGLPGNMEAPLPTRLHGTIQHQQKALLGALDKVVEHLEKLEAKTQELPKGPRSIGHFYNTITCTVYVFWVRHNNNDHFCLFELSKDVYVRIVPLVLMARSHTNSFHCMKSLVSVLSPSLITLIISYRFLSFVYTQWHSLVVFMLPINPPFNLCRI